MNLGQLHQRLIASARRSTPADDVPFGFETRVMARLREVGTLDVGAQWARGLWRASAPCVAVMLLLMTWALFSPNSASVSGNAANGDLSQELDNLVLAAASPEPLADSTW